MKKSMLFIFIVIISLFIITSISSAADMDTWEGYGGFGYNTYNLEEVNNFTGDEVESGVSFLAGFRGWVRPNIAIGVEIESMEVQWGNHSFEAGTTGYLGTINYEFIPGISIYGAGGLYFVELEGLAIEERDSSVGFKLGVEGNYNISDSLTLQARVVYRNNNVDTGFLDLDFSGFGVNTALVYKF